jgi:hypothetical protein
MFRWQTPPADSADGQAVAVFRFAAEHAAGPLTLSLDLEGAAEAVPPPLQLEGDAAGSVAPLPVAERRFRYNLEVPPATNAHQDDEWAVTLAGSADGTVPPCRAILRRTAWSLDTTLLDGQRGPEGLAPQTRAALLWHGWGRYQRLVGLKRFGGLSGCDVVVFQPMLRKIAGEAPPSRRRGDAGQHAWGSHLVVKTGVRPKVRAEWDRFNQFLTDRLHPFMARSEVFLDVQPPGPAAVPAQATLIGSFLGGNLMQVEPLEYILRNATDPEACLTVLERLFAVTEPWYAGAAFQPLARWQWVFGGQVAEDHGEIRPPEEDGKLKLRLFSKFDLTEEADLARYVKGLSWDPAFITSRHLVDHLLARDGLIHRLLKLPVRFSLTHGDLHPRNVLADGDNVWLLDFGETGVATPTLFDFAKLEVYLRLWCLDLSPAAKDLDAGSAKLERHLLDVMLGITSGQGAMSRLAAMIGARPRLLRKVAACITWIRQRAMAYTQGGPERIDYLAVLYLTVLGTLPYAAKERDKPANYRLLMTLACLLEDLLCRLLGLPPFERGRQSLDHKLLLTADWLRAPNAPARAAYLMHRRDGRLALPFLAATRGVMQSQFHHLDVFDHTLLVLANLEALLDDPVGMLRHPQRFRERVAAGLRAQRLPLEIQRHGGACAHQPQVHDLEPLLATVGHWFRERWLPPAVQLPLKWCALLHDVGKPASRCVQVDGQGRRRVQFRGHEAYSAFLASEHLRHWFPDEAVAERLDGWIRRHHLHHNLMMRFFTGDAAGTQRLAALRQEVLKGQNRGELGQLFQYLGPNNPDLRQPDSDVPILLLHGFADMAACDGPESDLDLGQVAEANLILLAGCVRFQEQAGRKRAEERAGAALRRLGLPPGRLYGEVKKRLVEGLLAQAGDPEDEALFRQAQELAAQVPDPQGAR